MTQYIVFRHTEETRSLMGNLRKYYETAIVGYFIGERGKKRQSVKTVAYILKVPELDINLVPMTANDSDTRSSIARIKGDITKR